MCSGRPYPRGSVLCALATSWHSLRYCLNKEFIDQSLASAYHYTRTCSWSHTFALMVKCSVLIFYSAILKSDPFPRRESRALYEPTCAHARWAFKHHLLSVRSWQILKKKFISQEPFDMCSPNLVKVKGHERSRSKGRGQRSKSVLM